MLHKIWMCPVFWFYKGKGTVVTCAVKVQMGNRGVASFIGTLALDGREWSVTLQPVYPRREPQYPLKWKLGGPHMWSGWSTLTGMQSPIHPGHSKSLYWYVTLAPSDCTKEFQSWDPQTLWWCNVLTVMYMWHISRRWYSSDLHGHHWHLSICLTATPRLVPHHRRNQCQVFGTKRWQLASCQHMLQTICQPNTL